MGSATFRASSARFAPTHWRVVLSAKEKDSPGVASALEALCRAYWYPLYAYARRQGYAPAEAQELTQDFFSRLMQRDDFGAVSRERARFRSFLLGTFKRFIAKQRARAMVDNRVGTPPFLSLNLITAENLYASCKAKEIPADKLFDRRWALALQGRTMSRLREEYVSSGKGETFDQLKPFLTAAKGEVHYAEVGMAIGLPVNAMRTAVNHLRQRHRDVFREEIAHTVASSADLDAEVKYVTAVLES